LGESQDGSADADALLIADCEAFEAAFGRERAAAGACQEEADSLADETDAAFARIPGATPTTEAGLRAKAAAAMVRLLWRAAPLSGVPWRDQVSDGERAAVDCLAAVGGRPLP
jgi:hypothetical protein